MNHLFDDVDDGNRGKVESSKRYRQRLHLAAKIIIYQFGSPQVLALQEVENINVLNDIGNLIFTSGGPKYRSILLEGNDISGIDIGYLIRADLRIREIKQLFKNDRFSVDHTPLFSRPPLLIEVCRNKCITLVNLHLRSMRGLRSVKKSKRVARKRISQATRTAKWIDQFQIRNPLKSIMILGDFNALQPPDIYSDIVGIIMGKPDNTKQLYPAKDWINKDLLNLTQQIPVSERFSYVYMGVQQTLDYMLINQNFEPRLNQIKFNRIDRKFSDHAGLLAEFNW